MTDCYATRIYEVQDVPWLLSSPYSGLTVYKLPYSETASVLSICPDHSLFPSEVVLLSQSYLNPSHKLLSVDIFIK